MPPISSFGHWIKSEKLIVFRGALPTGHSRQNLLYYRYNYYYVLVLLLLLLHRYHFQISFYFCLAAESALRASNPRQDINLDPLEAYLSQLDGRISAMENATGDPLEAYLRQLDGRKSNSFSIVSTLSTFSNVVVEPPQ